MHGLRRCCSPTVAEESHLPCWRVSLVQAEKRRTTPYSEPFSEVTAPNQLWCMDFKGYSSTGDGTRCDPFTITDAHTRYLIRCQIVSRMDLSQVRAVCEAAMRECSVPCQQYPMAEAFEQEITALYEAREQEYKARRLQSSLSLRSGPRLSNLSV